MRPQTPDEWELLHQLRAELQEARGQLDEALRDVEVRLAYGPGGPPVTPIQRFRAWHKCHEAATNLLNVAEALK